MIQQQTLLKIADNSGAKTARCIKVLGGVKKRYAYVGDIIVVSIIELRNKAKKTSKVKRGDIFKALVIKSKTSSATKDGSNLKFSTNSASLMNKQGKPLSSRITGPTPSILKKGKFSRFNTISSGSV